jgi:hypothetical protein
MLSNAAGKKRAQANFFTRSENELQARNELGYATIASSSPMTVDLSPPKTGKIRNALVQTILSDMCTASEFQRCYMPTPKANHAFKVDGLGSVAVLNGHDPLVDTRYAAISATVPLFAGRTFSSSCVTSFSFFCLPPFPFPFPSNATRLRSV